MDAKRLSMGLRLISAILRILVSVLGGGRRRQGPDQARL